MKILTLTILALITSTFIINAQEIIKSKSTFSTQNKTVTFSNPSGIDNYIKGDSSLIIRLYCGPTQSEAIKPLFLIKAGEQYFKSDNSEFKKYLNKNIIQGIYVLRKEAELYKFGALAKNGVIIINVEKDKVNEILNFSKSMKYELIK